MKTAEEREVIKIGRRADFYNLLNELNLTDRQKQIFVFKYSRGWRNIDIAEELNIKKYTMTEECKAIREKLASYYKTLQKDA